MTHDFIVVGSGAGGGPLAANLSLAGFSVLLIEAGEHHTNDNYEIPALHPRSTEDPIFSWEFYVKHYDHNPQRDPKYHAAGEFPGAPGIFYPRATGIGGCTAHHAMITVYPHESDWNDIASLIGDESWNAQKMRKYFDECVENPIYNDSSKFLRILDVPDLEDVWDRVTGFFETALRRDTEINNSSRSGWLAVSQADPTLLKDDPGGVLKVVVAAVRTALHNSLGFMPQLNPNHKDVAKENSEGINVIPVSINRGKRIGSRDRIEQAQNLLNSATRNSNYTGRLDIATNTLATRVVFSEGSPTKAIGVECLKGKALYNARHHTVTSEKAGERVTYIADKEVILCGGAFNTPQLLMLSGIGPAAELNQHGIEVLVDSPKVGKNLQDRYEVGVVAKVKEPFALLEGAKFKGKEAEDDPHYKKWLNDGGGLYGTNGSVLGIIKRSETMEKKDPSGPPDLYIFGVPGHFEGYQTGYSDKVYAPDHFTWAVLKGHTDNRSGYVKLKSNNPVDTPEIHFKYFEESDELASDDVQSVVDGVIFVKKINKRLMEDGLVTEIVAPNLGEGLEREGLEQYVRNNAWGHHASCTCAIGPNNDDVLDNDFRVRGTENLRIVDASVFPRIPGLFILASVYMISEKASDVIIAKYGT